MNIGFRRFSILLAFLTVVTACRGGGVGQATLHNTQEVINDNRIGADEYLKITDIVRTEQNSIHLVQVRGEIAPHYHKNRSETVYILSGTGLLVIRQAGVNEMNTVVKAGDIVTIPPGAVHSFHPSQAGVLVPTVALSIFTPPFDGKDRIQIEPKK